jgi:DNA-binding SARP family transcriptional activator/tetratricopeptide (TPR) repeat protein
LLGGFRCALDGRPVEGLSYDKMRALFAWLAMSPGQDHRREMLAELFWSGSDPATARGNLRRTLSDLRRVLEVPTGKVLFSTGKSTICLVAGVEIDAVQFIAQATQDEHGPAQQDAEGAVDLYRGEFMANFYLPECPAFEDWLSTQREALHRRALALLERLANSRESVGDHGKALQFALRYLELEPWDEAAHRRVMRLYALSGQGGAALRQFEACSRLLKKELGITPGAETRELAERIRTADLASIPTDMAGAPPRTIQPAPPPRHAERRQVTVLFCELALHGIEDPDDAMELLLGPRARCVETLRQLSGHVVPMHGGGVLAYFGYPQAWEDCAVRAVRAALAATRGAAHGIDIRAGVHTGLILTGGDPSVPDIVGKTSAVAVHLLRAIGCNEVAISQETHQLVAGYFDCTSRGRHILHDASRPVAVFRVEKESGARTRLDASARLTRLVGRRRELAQLTASWEQAKRGHGRAVLVQGEPAIGKSRLVHALQQRLAGEVHTTRELRCFPEYSQSPFHPLLVLLEEIVGFAPGDAPALKSARLAQHVAANYPTLGRDAVPLLVSLCSLPQPADHVAPGLSPARQKEETYALLMTMLKHAPARQPVLLIVEDLHWADPSTLALLTALVAQCEAEAMLAVFTARPGFNAPAAASVLQLAPLAERDMVQLIESVGGALAAATVHHIVQRADGVPLFAEELAKTATQDDWASIPGTLHDVLAARIDRLGEAKYTARLAATIGREFGVDLLCKVSPCERHALERFLAELEDAGLVSKLDAATCQFRHALIQEAAYQSQGRTDRRAAHRRIAQVLQDDYPERIAARPELMAQHLASAGDIRPSIDHWTRAGHRAISGSANLEAIAHFNHALQSLMTLAATRERDQSEFSILVGLCPALHATQGYGSEEATRVTARLSALREQAADGPELFLSEWTRLRNTVASVGPRGVPQAAMQLLEQARDDPIRKQAAHYVVTVASFWLGDFATSKAHAAEAMALYRPAHHHLMLDLFGEDLSVSFAGHLSWALCFLGFTDQAYEVCGRMLRQARAMSHPKTLAMALLFATMLRRWLNMHAETLSFAAEAIALTRQHGMLHWLATSEALQGKARVMQGGGHDLSELMALAARLSAASPSYSAVRRSDMAELHIHLERYDEALHLLAQAQADETSTGSRQFAAERHRLEGLCLLALSPPDTMGAEAAFERALAISRSQGARTLELRSAMSMARLWRQQGKAEQARHLLATTHAWFTEGFGTPDLVQAAALLREAA